MKKLYFHRHNPISRSRLFSFGVALVAVAAVFVLLRFVAPTAFITVVSPLLRTGSFLSAGTGQFMDGFENAQQLVVKQNALIKQNVALSRQNQILAARVKDLVALIGTSSSPLKGVVADVLAHPPESPFGTLVIDVGTRAGVVSGDEVLAMGGTPVGKVSSVTANGAWVSLFSSPHSTTTAWVGSGRTPIILEGIGGDSFTAHTPRSAQVSVGDTVFVSGRGIRPVGTVVRLDAEPAAVTETLRIRPLVNTLSLTTVEVLLSHTP